MAIFVVLWSYLLTTKLRCLQKNNFGHTTGAQHSRGQIKTLFFAIAITLHSFVERPEVISAIIAKFDIAKNIHLQM